VPSTFEADDSMIVFNLTCSNDHRFEGWFVSAAEFERQQQATLLNCPLCGSTEISKGMHAPYVNTGSGRPLPQRGPQSRETSAQYVNINDDIIKLVKDLVANTEDVGSAFPEEARKIHYQESPERKIRGQASQEEVLELRDEGIEVVAIPVPRYLLDKTH
jgi:hypothetical protein